MDKLSKLNRPETTIERSEIIKEKKFLKYVYEDFYRIFEASSKNLPEGKRVELGSGGGFLKEIIPKVITSDVIKLPNCDLQFEAEKMPFRNNSVSIFYLLNVFHHLKDLQRALQEMERCLKKRGEIVMVEPYNSLWSRFIYRNFHHENFDSSAGWKIEEKGPLSGANSALPWIVFHRDRALFEKNFPALKIIKFEPHTPFRYLISGGCSFRQILPGFMYKYIRSAENLVKRLNKYLGMFVTIEIRKLT